MSRSLTIKVVYEQLQQVLHDLHDLSMFGDNKPFRGIVISDVEFVWRDDPLSHWTIRIEPMEPPHPQPLTHVLREVTETVTPQRTQQWIEGDRVQVAVTAGVNLAGIVAKIQDPGPYKTYQTIKVRFDDPLVMGGTGEGWFSPMSVAPEDGPAPEPEE